MPFRGVFLNLFPCELFRCILHHRGASRIAPQEVGMLPIFEFGASEQESNSAFERDVPFHIRYDM